MQKLRTINPYYLVLVVLAGLCACYSTPRPLQAKTYEQLATVSQLEQRAKAYAKAREELAKADEELAKDRRTTSQSRRTTS